MATFDATSDVSTSSDNQTRRPTWVFTLLAFAIAWLGQLVLYIPMFQVLPAGDDFPMMHEILRGNETGPMSLIRVSGSTQNYRPVKSLGLWAFGNISPEHRVFWIHTLHFASATALTLVCLLWTRTAPIGRAGVVAAAIVMTFHPILVASIASLDGFDSTLSTCFIWLGVWLVYRFRENLLASCLLVAVCFMIGGVTKEYTFSLVLLAAWTCYHFTGKHGLKRAVVIGCVLMVCFVLLMFVRHHTMVAADQRGLVFVSVNPGQWASNLTMFFVGLFLPGNTVWIFLNRFSPLMLVSIPMIAILCGVVFGGAWKCWEEKGSRHDWINYLVIATVLAMFPMIIMEHVSEMYLPPLLVPFALICGIAADGWRRYSVPMQVTIGVICLAMLGNSVWAIEEKLAGMRLVGDRTDMQLDKLLAVLPRDAKDAKICLAYNTFGMRANRHYSVFAMGDEIMLVHDEALDWKAPERKLAIDTFPNSSEPPPDDAKFDYYVVWDHRNNEMRLSRRDSLWR
jgi:hypothetical protein